MAKIDISFEPAPGYWDFGNFKPNKKDYTIKVDQKFWIKFIEARKEFEILHSELTAMARKKIK